MDLVTSATTETTWYAIPDRVFDGTSVHLDTAVAVAGDRIVAVLAAGDVPDGADRRRLAGQTLSPGLIDGHVHFAPWTAFGFLAAGVTTVRDCGNDVDAVVALLDELGDHPRPTIHWSGPLMESERVNWPSVARAHHSPDEIRATVAESARRGWHAVKLYANATPELAAAAADEARHHGLRTLCHLGATTLPDAVAARVDELQHLAGCLGADLGIDRDVTAEAVAAAPVDHCPTFVVWLALATLGEPRAGRDASWRWVTPSMRTAWSAGYHATQPAPERLRRLDQLLERLAMVPALVAAGRTIVVGSDAPFPGLVPGWSLHDEAGLLVLAGIDPLDVLRSLTTGNAAVLGDPDAGTIRPGARADLVAFEGDPTTAIADLSRVAAVWCRGVEIDLVGLAERADDLFPQLSPSPLDDIAARRFVPATAT